MTLKDVAPAAKTWLTYVLFAALLMVGGVGTCLKYVPQPVPIPTPGPTPGPIPGPTPNPISEVWQALELPAKNIVSGLELPAPMQISSTRKYIIITAKCASPVRWLISAKSGVALEALESKLTNSILIFTTGQPQDTIVALAYSVISGKPTDTAITFVHLTNDTPPPEPGPEPTPTPGPTALPSKLHVTFLLDFTKTTRAVSDVINSADLRQWLASRGHKIHEVSIRDADKYNLDVELNGKTPPLLVLQAQAEGAIKEGTLVKPDGILPLLSVQGVKDAVLKATGKKE